MNALTIKNLRKTYSYDRNGTYVLNDINIDFKMNQRIGLLGKNGAGKTTFIKSCIDLLTFEGEIEYFGNSLYRMTKRNKSRLFSALLEGNRNIYWKLTPIENVRYFASLRGIQYKKIEKIVLQLLEDLFLLDKKDTLVENLSRGMQQKVAIVCALSMNTPVVFLDEPTLGLDLESKNHIIDFICNNKYIENKLIFITSHDLDFINKVSSSIYLLKNGQLFLYEKNQDAQSVFSIQILRNGNNLDKLREHIPIKDLITNPKSWIFLINCKNNNLSKIIQIIEEHNFEIISIISEEHNIENFYLS